MNKIIKYFLFSALLFICLLYRPIYASPSHSLSVNPEITSECLDDLDSCLNKFEKKIMVYKIYYKLITMTGQSQDALPLVIAENEYENAFNDGTRIVIFTGLINKAKNWDEVALVLAHEIAHGMLGHSEISSREEFERRSVVLESNADKYGAFLMMKAGYDICKGREIFKRWKEQNGNALNESHPDYSYRYDELNIGCDSFFSRWF